MKNSHGLCWTKRQVFFFAETHCHTITIWSWFEVLKKMENYKNIVLLGFFCVSFWKAGSKLNSLRFEKSGLPQAAKPLRPPSWLNTPGSPNTFRRVQLLGVADERTTTLVTFHLQILNSSHVYLVVWCHLCSGSAYSCNIYIYIRYIMIHCGSIFVYCSISNKTLLWKKTELRDHEGWWR